jgi:hypothetical protein
MTSTRTIGQKDLSVISPHVRHSHLIAIGTIFAALLAPAVAVAAPVMPAAMRGHWVLLPAACNTADYSAHLRISATELDHGETLSTVTAVRRVSDVQYGIDLSSASDSETWTTTNMMVLTARGQRLSVLITREQGKRVPSGPPSLYRRCAS